MISLNLLDSIPKNKIREDMEMQKLYKKLTEVFQE
jgi:hypothetical protein